jgi:hypothetical protein
MDTGSSFINVRAIVPVLTASTAIGMGRVNNQGVRLRKSTLNPNDLNTPN